MDEVDQLKERFKNHVLTEVLNTNNIKVFDFRKNDGSTWCYQRWIIDRGTLIVQGDNYDAIYRWNSTNVTLKFLAECNLGYFSEKCRADKDGDPQEVFDDKYASDFLKSIAADNIFHEENTEISEDEWAEMSTDKKIEKVKPFIMEQLQLDFDFEFDDLFYAENHYDAYEILIKEENEFMFGTDAWELGSSLLIKTMTPKMHLAALRAAYDKYPNAF
jgi:hypothetical protein